MKKIALLTVTLGLLGLNVGNLLAASANTNAMIVKLALTAEIQAPVLSVTNTPDTNSTYTVTKVKIANKDILNLLAVEFGISFPVGAQLGLTPDFDFVVLDSAGNIFTNVSANLNDSDYVFGITNNSATTIIIGKVAGKPAVTTETVTEMASDFTIYYQDGHGNNFHFGGLVTVKAVALVTSGGTTYKTVSLSVPCSGSGTFFNPSDGHYDEGIMTGTFSSAGAGLPQ